jgi:threonine dehydrogenase-like Zn-dependent dehydrogenase
MNARAAVFHGDRKVSQVEMTVPAPQAAQVRIRLEGCGVCASNLPVWEGRPWFNYPFTPGSPGHEGWGVIDAVGEDVKDLEVNDRVAFLSTNAYAQYDISEASAAVKLPAELAGQPFPGEPLACVMNIFRRSDIQRGQTVAIVGIGFLGAALTALAVRAGAKVIALSRRDYSLEFAERFGASSCIRLEDPSQAARAARRICGEAGCDRVIEAVGSQQALDVASELVGVRARLVIAGYHQDGARSVDLQRWNWLGIDVINAHERDPARYREGMQEAIALITRGQFDPAPLYTHHVPLEEISAAFAALSERPSGFLKALIRCN